MRVENFRNYNIYNRSLDLMISIYQLIDNYKLDICDKRWKEIFQIAIKTPKLIASGISQTNMKVRIKKLNDAKDRLIELRLLLNRYEDQDNIGKFLFEDIERNRIQVLKMLNAYFGWLKKQKS